MTDDEDKGGGRTTEASLGVGLVLQSYFSFMDIVAASLASASWAWRRTLTL